MLSANALHKFGQTKSKLYSRFSSRLLLESMALSGSNVLLSWLLHRKRGVDPASFFAAEGGICLSGLVFPITPYEICPVVAAAAPIAVPLSATATHAAYLWPIILVMGSSLSRVWSRILALFSIFWAWSELRAALVLCSANICVPHFQMKIVASIRQG